MAGSNMDETSFVIALRKFAAEKRLSYLQSTIILGDVWKCTKNTHFID